MNAVKNFIKIHNHNLDERLSYIKSLALSMGGCVEEIISDAKEIVLGQDRSEERFLEMKKREEEINFLQKKLSKSCFRSLARQAPVAKDLRLILTLLNANTDLERMGDLSINIAKRSQKLDFHPNLKQTYSTLEHMFNSAIEMVSISLNSFVKEDEHLAQKVLRKDDMVDEALTKIIEELKPIMENNSNLISTCVNIIIIAVNVERIADHCTNLSEEIIFLKTGKDVRHGQHPFKENKNS